MSSEINKMINMLVVYFKRFEVKKKATLPSFSKKSNDAQKTLKRFLNIRWLSRFQAIILV
jgi:hypothetical protein